MNLAIIKSGIVENVIVVSDQNQASSRAHWEAKGYAVVASDVASIGDVWNNVTFEPGAAAGPVDTWLIGVGSFYDRFGDQKIPILASTDPVVQALVKDAQVRKYIDLKRADLPTMLAILNSKGFTVDANAILSVPAAPHELP